MISKKDYWSNINHAILVIKKIMLKKYLLTIIFALSSILLVSHGYPAPYFIKENYGNLSKNINPANPLFVNRWLFTDLGLITKLLLIKKLGREYIYYKSCALNALYILTGRKIWAIIDGLEVAGMNYGIRPHELFDDGTPSVAVRDYLFSQNYKIISASYSTDDLTQLGGRVFPKSLNELVTLYGNAYVHIKPFTPEKSGHSFAIKNGVIYDSWESYKSIAFSRQPDGENKYFIESIFYL